MLMIVHMKLYVCTKDFSEPKKNWTSSFLLIGMLQYNLYSLSDLKSRSVSAKLPQATI